MDTLQTSETIVLAVTIPVAVPVDCDWKELHDLATPAFRLSTELANWAVQALFRLDSANTRDCPSAIKECNLYDLAKRKFPGWKSLTDEVCKSASAVLRKVQAKYIEDRFDFMFSHNSSLLSYRFPQPFPIPNASWRLCFEARSEKIAARVVATDRSFENNLAPIFTLNLPNCRGVRLRLRQGRDFRRQLAMLEQILTGDELLAQGLIHRKERGETADEAEERIRQNATMLRRCNAAIRGEASLVRKGTGKNTEYLVKIVGTFPAKHRNDQERVRACLLSTQPHALLCCEIDGQQQVSITNCDQFVRMMAQARTENERHRRFLQRSSEDKKNILRRSPRQLANFEGSITSRCTKARDRMSTAIKQIATGVAEYLDRRRVGCVVYDDTKRQFIEDVKVGDQSLSFPWFMLMSELKTRLQALGMLCVFPCSASAKESQREEYAKWLASPNAMWATALSGKRLGAHRARKNQSHPAVSKPSAT